MTVWRSVCVLLWPNLSGLAEFGPDSTFEPPIPDHLLSANCRKPVRHPRWPGGPHGPFASVRRSPGVRRVRFRTKVFTLEGQIWSGSSVCGRSGRIQADLEVGSPAGQRSGAWPAWRLRVATRGHGKSRESPVARRTRRKGGFRAAIPTPVRPL